MFKHRVLTLLVLVPLLLLAILYLPMPWFSLLIGAVMLWAAWEWSPLAGIKNYYFRTLYVITILLALIGTYYLPIFWVLIISFIIWLWAAAAVICYAKGFFPMGFQYNVIKIVVSFFVLTSCWVVGVALREDMGGPGWLVFGLVLIWAMDIGAYLAGRWWGKRTLIARVSPNKTWEGLVGGIVLTLAIAVIISLVFRQPLFRLILISLLALITAIFAIIGDLFESMLKRQAGVKDTGQLLPGHGGILDRIDSILAALPIFLLGSLWIWLI
ncbi:phosphatidate cytidylyltransferase [Candidatus Coxiella mudrowiae]|uniref:Phosphatidate cytidylyltransferase n=1 Tax=Candidatus Coxiella mudrowiae TaxID=2054173 RepID=A0ABN4HNZ0_9COXI|nr:phosphatidate cytidylyltransferase [Candidatus Coxiella mudrowiae]AKQ33365.1 Phosphatidate cytidylyltransferase [Candidatus Coxiella mudrowiae]